MLSESETRKDRGSRMGVGFSDGLKAQRGTHQLGLIEGDFFANGQLEFIGTRLRSGRSFTRWWSFVRAFPERAVTVRRTTDGCPRRCGLNETVAVYLPLSGLNAFLSFWASEVTERSDRA